MRRTLNTLLIRVTLLLLLIAPNVSVALQSVVDIGAGGSRACAILSGGGLKCWGDNSVGELGTGTKLDRNFPCDVTGLSSGVVAVAPGEHHTCALFAVGGVKCWGDNYLGQLGNGTTMDKLTATDVSGLTSVAAISSGAYHSCALKTNGAMMCWGGNSFGSIGDGTRTDRTAPVDVQNLASGVIGIAAGGYHSCALLSGGDVKCWGSNFYGQMGDGTKIDKAAPAAVSGLGGAATAIAAGDAHTCALMSGGGVKCWGSNRFGSLGDGTTTDSSSPVDVSGLGSGVTKITARGYHTCALLSSGGGVKCWGKNFSGELGNGAFEDSSVPVDVDGLTGVQAIAAADDSTCAVLNDNTPVCWGDDYHGTLGDGGTDDSPSPLAVLDIFLLTGTVSFDATGLSDVTLTMTRGTDSSVETGVTNVSGDFSIPNMTNGTAYRLMPSKDGYNFIPEFADGLMAGNGTQNFSAVAWTPSPTPNVTATPTPTPTATPAGPTPTPSIVAPTATPTSLNPQVKALRSVILYKDTGLLRYQIRERSGRTKESIKVKKGRTILKTLSVKMKAVPYTGIRSVNFKSKGLAVGKYSFCVTATNPKGKKSKESCAELKIL